MNQAVDLDELTLFRDMARRAFEQEITPHYEAWEEERMVPRTLWNRLGEAGLLCPDMEEQYGGAGTSPHVTLAMIEELSEMGFGGFASSYGIHNNIIAPTSAVMALRSKKCTGYHAWPRVKSLAHWQ